MCFPPSKKTSPDASEPIIQIQTGALEEDKFWTSVAESVNTNVVHLFFKKYSIHIVLDFGNILRFYKKMITVLMELVDSTNYN